MERKIHLSTLLADWYKMLVMIILGSCILAMAGDMFSYQTKTSLYCSEATLNVAARKGDSRYSLYTNLNVTQQMAKTFSYIMNSDIIEQVVEEDLGVKELDGRIQTSVTKDTNILTLRVYGDSSQEAFEIMQSILNHYQDLCSQVMPGAYVELLSMPKVPLYPVNPLSHIRNLVVFGTLSFVMLSACVLYYSYFKDTIKSADDISSQIDATLLASLPFQSRKKGDRGILVTDVKTSFSYVEAFKRMRVKIENGNDQVILVTSSLQNEGKSTVSANLAVTLAKNKKKVLLMDLDLRNPSIAGIFGYQVEAGILDFLEGRKTLADILIQDETFNLSMILGQGTTTLAPELINQDKMKQLMDALREYYDYIIIDSVPSSFLSDALVTLEYCDAMICVVKQNYAKSKTINDTLDLLRESDKKLLGCVFNHSVKHRFGGSSHYGYYGGYKGYYGYKKYGYGGYKYGYGEYGKNERKQQSDK